MGIDSRRFSPCPNVAVYDDIIFNDVRAAEADLEQRLDGDVIYFTSEIRMNISSSSGRGMFSNELPFVLGVVTRYAAGCCSEACPMRGATD
jgi:hypothetical protein